MCERLLFTLSKHLAFQTCLSILRNVSGWGTVHGRISSKHTLAHINSDGKVLSQCHALVLDMCLYCTLLLLMLSPHSGFDGMQVGEAKRVLVQSGQVPADENSSVAGQMSGLAISA